MKLEKKIKMQHKSPLVSVIVPVYNVEVYLEKCLQSIIGQRYENLEILLVNDGATDSSGEICQKYANIDNRIKLFNKQNGGLSDARNFALDRATGQYYTFVDSDDYIHENMYATMLALITEEKADIAICGHYVVDGEKLIAVRNERQIITYTGEEALLLLLKDEQVNSFAWDKLYRSTLFEDIRYPVGRIFEDTATTYKIFDLANRIVRQDIPFYYYVRRKSSLSGAKSLKKDHHNFLGFYERFMFANSKQIGDIDEGANKALMHGMNVIDAYAISENKDKEKDTYLNTLKKIKEILKMYKLNNTEGKSLKYKLFLFNFNSNIYVFFYTLFHKIKMLK